MLMQRHHVLRELIQVLDQQHVFLVQRELIQVQERQYAFLVQLGNTQVLLDHQPVLLVQSELLQQQLDYQHVVLVS
jgi:hypothetical protein